MAADRDTNPTTGLSAASRPEADGRSPGVERVQSVERSFAILSKLHGKPQTLTQLVDSVELAKSTVNRLLATLVAVGAVVLDRVSGLYSIGPLITAMGQAPRVSLTRVAEPILRQLASTIGEAVGLGVRDFFEVLYVADIDADTEIQLRTWVGERVPMHAVPSGIVLLAAMDAADRDEVLARPLRPFTDRTIVDADQLRARLHQFAVHGVAWGKGEFSSDINSVAAAITDRNGATIAALHAHGPAYRFPGDQGDVYEALVSQAAVMISQALAGAAHIDVRPS